MWSAGDTSNFLFSCCQSDSLWPHELQHTRLCCPSLSDFAQTHVHWVTMPSNHLILRPHLLLPSIFPSIRIFSNELGLHIRWPEYYSFSFSVSPSNEYSGLMSFRIDWFDLLAIQETLKESSPAPQFESINSSALSLLYDPTLTSIHDYWKNYSFDQMDLCWQSDVSFNRLSKSVIAFLPRSKCLNFIAAVTIDGDFRAQENTICHCFHLSPIYLP